MTTRIAAPEPVTPVKERPAVRASRSLMSRMVALPRSGKGSASAPTSAQLIRAIREGLPASELTDLKELLGVPNETLARMAGVSKATLNRWGPEHRLSPEEGDRVVRFGLLLALAMDVMGTREHARTWLTSPQIGLGGATPLDHALTELGAREVEDLLGRIEHGVYT